MHIPYGGLVSLLSLEERERLVGMLYRAFCEAYEALDDMEDELLELEEYVNQIMYGSRAGDLSY
ncbi:MAG: hypothetical protein ACM3TU_02995 [Bacillota bacterium]